jgi:predicted dehydrogenase
MDSALWLGGHVAQVYALTRDGAAAVALRFESGALALVDVCRDARYGFECSAELVGARATARLGYASRRTALELLRDGRAAAPLAADHAERHDAAYVRELEAFGELVLGGRPAVPRGQEAAAALELALLASRSAALGVPIEVAAARTPLAVAGRPR